MRTRLALCAACLALACGAPSHVGSASVSGTIGGAAFTLADASGFNISGQCTSANSVGQELLLVLADQPTRCNDFSEGEEMPDATLLTLGVDVGGAAAAPLGPGSYAVSAQAPLASAPAAFAWFQQTGPTGEPLAAALAATGGSLTITGVDGGAISGTFLLAFGSDSISGSFTSASCAWSSSTFPPWCD